MRKTFLILAAIVFITCTGLAQTAETPNVVVIICDDLNDTIAGMGGHSQAKTPNIDRLMDQGVRFINAASNAPLCGPSRASLWSGLFPSTTGYYGYRQQENHWRDNPTLKNVTTLFELFTRSGYYNYATGKIHHNGHEDMSIFENQDGTSGFGTQGNFGPVPYDGSPEHINKGVTAPWMPSGYLEEGDGLTYEGFGPLRDLKPYGEKYYWTLLHNNGVPWEYRNGYDRDPMPDEVNAAEAVEFLGKNHDSPFLLTVGFSRPHSPMYAPQEFFDLFPLDSLRLTPMLENDIEDCAKILVEQHDIPSWGWHKYQRIMNNGGKEQLLKFTQAYLACVAFVDAQAGKVLDALAESPYSNNTIVVLTSDHGYHLGEKEYVFKFSPWEESVRVPLVIAGPGIAENEECNTPVSLVDLYPTLVDYAGLQAPHQLDGNSLRPLLENPATGEWEGLPASLSVVASKEPLEINQPGKAVDQHFSLRDKQYRYIHCRNGEEELYDHKNDPNEWHNLASDSAHQQVILSMRKNLKKYVPDLGE